MKLGQFIWADLSTYNTARSIEFYKSIFGWSMVDSEKYYVAQLEENNVVGVFETPD